MKRAFLVFLFCLFFPLSVFAGGTCAVTEFPDISDVGKMGKIVRLTCTASASDGSMAYTLTSTDMAKLAGYYLYTVTVYPTPGGTAPTDLSDLAITDDRGVVILSATSNGANIVDATSSYQILPERTSQEGTSDFYQKIHYDKELTVAITNSIVNSANVTIDLDMVP